MNNMKKARAKKVLKKYNYWRKSFGLLSRSRHKLSVGSSCQVACHSDPCQSDPTCSFD